MQSRRHMSCSRPAVSLFKMAIHNTILYCRTNLTGSPLAYTIIFLLIALSLYQHRVFIWFRELLMVKHSVSCLRQSSVTVRVWHEVHTINTVEQLLAVWELFTNNTRKRNVTWYTPPFDLTVKTNIGKQFLKIIDSSFPPNNPLRKIFNRNSVKISYSCLPNIKSMIDTHNKRATNRVDSQTSGAPRTCNCRNKNDCPLEGKCLEKSVIYQATVTTANTTETYVGLTENEFKTRYGGHKTSFNNYNRRHATELSKYVWSLKEKNTDYTLRWRILTKARAYSNTSKKYNLCLEEKYYITCRPELASLNKRSEIMNTCRHSRKFLLSSRATP